MHCHAAGRRTGQPPLCPHRRHGKARRSLRRQVPHHRLPPLQLHQFRHRHRGRADPVPPPGAEQLYRQRTALGPGRVHRRRPHPASLPGGQGRHLVQGHRQRHLSEPGLHRYARPRVRGHPLRRPHLQDGLFRHAGPPQGGKRRLHHLRHGGALGRGAPLRHHERGRGRHDHRVCRKTQGAQEQPGFHGHLRILLEGPAAVPHRR